MEAVINLTAVWNATSCVLVQISQNVGGETTSVFRVEKYSTQNGIQAIYSSESVANKLLPNYTVSYTTPLWGPQMSKLQKTINISKSCKIYSTLLFLSSRNVKENLCLVACYAVLTDIQLTTFQMFVVLSSSERISARYWTE